MEVYQVQDTKEIWPLVKGWNDTLIWSYLQQCMGQAWAPTLTNPESVQILVGDFCFFAGKPNKDLVSHRPRGLQMDSIVMVSKTEEWHALIEEVYKENAILTTRYAIKKEENSFDKGRLAEMVRKLAPEYSISMINEMLYNQITELPWCCDFCSNFRGYQEYKDHGLGVVILKNGEIVAGASSYTYYREGIEIEIDTREDYRRRGLATICGAKLILECLKKGLYPSWDAQNLESVSLSEKLGYHYDKEYPAYVINNYCR